MVYRKTINNKPSGAAKPRKGENKMTEERRQQIEDFANKTGLSFVDAQRMLEEIKKDDFSYGQTMAEIAY